MDEKLLRTGELSRRSGLSARTLRHYHHLNLLLPSALSPRGERLYSRSDIERLWQLHLLRGLGLSLLEVRAVLNDPDDPPGQRLQAHIRQRERHLASHTAYLEHLRYLASKPRPSLDDVLHALRLSEEARSSPGSS